METTAGGRDNNSNPTPKPPVKNTPPPSELKVIHTSAGKPANSPTKNK